MAVFDFSSYEQASHTPGPSQEGRLECCFFFDNLGFVWLFLILGAMRRRHTPPAPLERGDGESDLFV